MFSKASKVEDLLLDDDMSNYTYVIEYNDSVDEGVSDSGEKRPIMLLLQSLIHNKQNIVMTNALIIDILQREFNIDVTKIHELEVDIYIKIIEKYLKIWPEWKKLECMSTKLKNINNFKALSKVLDHKYKNLKEYLGVMLEAAKPLAREAVKSLSPKPKAEEKIESDVVMEIQCTRQQLNNLFITKPRLDLNNTVFNMSPINPTHISLKTLPFDEILSFLPIKITINAPCLSMSREILYNLKHLLVNKARNENTIQNICLNTGLQVRAESKRMKWNKSHTLNVISSMLEQCKAENEKIYEIALAIFNTIIKDLEDFPKGKQKHNLFRKYMNKYKYVRYLFVENMSSTDERYDLKLEETLSPMCQLFFKKMPKVCISKPSLEWFKIECTECLVKFSDLNVNLGEAVQSHYNSCHQNDPDWQCMNCKKMFSVNLLARNRFAHVC